MEYIKNSGKQKSVAFSVKKTLGDLVLKDQTPKHSINKQATPDFWNSLSPLRT